MKTNYQRSVRVKQDTTNMLAATQAAVNIREKVSKSEDRILLLYTILQLDKRQKTKRRDEKA